MNKRNTKTKQWILETIKNSGSAVSHEALQAELGDTMDRATIYRVLNSFCDDGLVHKITGDDGKQYFAFCAHCGQKKHRHNHFHFRCIHCGKVECLPTEMNIRLPEGYRSVNFNGFVSGYCGLCNQV